MTLLIALSLFAAPSDTLSLDQAYQSAIAAWPLRQQISLQESISELKTRNIGVRMLPAISIRSQAVYYSDVAEISLPGAGSSLPQPSNDQYKVALGVDQLIYDGGVTAQLKEIESLQRELEQGKIAVELYKLRQQVDAAFFGILTFGSQVEVLDLLLADLESRLQKIRSLVDNGFALQSNADILAAEMISVEQQRIEAVANREWASSVLSELIDRPVGADDVLILPARNNHPTPPPGRDRPEYDVFDLGRKALGGQASLIHRRDRPSVALFAETAFGRPPGLDFFETDFKPFYSAGIRMNWNPWKWKTGRRDRRILDLQKNLIDAEEQSFSKQIAIAVQKDLSEVRTLEQLLSRDEKVLTLRARISEQAASQLDNGVITASEYLTERNAESRAQLAMQLHRIQLSRARAGYLTTIGK